MLRRLAILGVLLLGLSGFVPAALACAMMTQQQDCCPPGHSCATDEGPAWTDGAALACCDAVPNRAPAAVAASVEVKKHVSQDLPPPEFPGAHPGGIASRGPPRFTFDSVVSFAFPPVRQDLYLRTGRLRL
jgi:hypothetical protein